MINPLILILMTKLLNSRISTLIFSKAELQGRALFLSVRKKEKVLFVTSGQHYQQPFLPVSAPPTSLLPQRSEPNLQVPQPSLLLPWERLWTNKPANKDIDLEKVKKQRKIIGTIRRKTTFGGDRVFGRAHLLSDENSRLALWRYSSL